MCIYGELNNKLKMAKLEPHQSDFRKDALHSSELGEVAFFPSAGGIVGHPLIHDHCFLEIALIRVSRGNRRSHHEFPEPNS